MINLSLLTGSANADTANNDFTAKTSLDKKIYETHQTSLCRSDAWSDER